MNQEIILLGDKLRDVELKLRAASDTYELTLNTNNENREKIDYLTQEIEKLESSSLLDQKIAKRKQLEFRNKEIFGNNARLK